MNKRTVGTKYEEMAAEYLKSRGYDILERNHRNPMGELDIIARKDGVTVYVEIKFRQDESCGDPLEAVDVWKRRRISRAAGWHYARNGARENAPCRFDVIGINGDGRIRHIENAFEFQP